MYNGQLKFNRADKKNKHTVRMLIIIGICVVGGFIWIHQESEIGQYDDTITHNNVTAKQYNTRAKNLTVHKLKKQYDKNEPNLFTLLGHTNGNIKNAVQYSFNHKNIKQFKNHQFVLRQQLGSSLSSTLNSILNPNANSEYTNVVNDGHLLSQRLKHYTVSFGNFDDMEGTVPVNIYINFITPKFPNTSSVTEKKYAHEGNVEIDGTLFVHSHEIQVNHYYMIIRPGAYKG